MARGTLRVYLGAAPGVGKTFAMLNEGHRRHERGADVVVGYVETHGRANTQAQLRDLEVVPRRQLRYRDAVFEEMDLDAVLARRPEIVLVDELAHTNITGSRHEKRWQDIEELLDAGIDVITTVNVQHLESLNDVVQRITGVTQRETVPDRVVRRADQIELVDMSPEALRRRMAHGNIYPAERIDAALGNYFRPGNLGALRELALLWVADRVEESLHDYLVTHGIGEAWETRERVAVAVTGAPGGDTVIRRASRLAGRVRGDVVGVRVVPADGLAVSAGPHLDAQRRLLTELGATYHEVVGNDVAAALVGFAQAEKATQLVVGASRRSRLAHVVRGSIVTQLLRIAGSIDVHVISSSELVAPMVRLPRPPVSVIARRRRLEAVVLGLVGFPLMTAIGLALGDAVALATELLVALALVVAISALGGIVIGLVAAVFAFLITNWFFVPPVHTFTVAEPENVTVLLVFLAVAGTVSALVDRVARRSDEALRARAEAEALARTTATLVGEADPLASLLNQVRAVFDLRGASVLSADGGSWLVEAGVGDQVPADPSQGRAFPLDGTGTTFLVLLGEDLDPEDLRVLHIFADQLCVAMATRRHQHEAAAAEAMANTDAVRTAMLQAVSHDLRSPLASIKTSVTSLLQDDVDWSGTDRRELLTTIDGEADRLNRLVGSLLDMSRLQAGALTMDLADVALEDVVGSAVASLTSPPTDLEVDVDETVPLVRVDAILLERSVANVLANAATWSPPGQPVRVEAGAVGDRVHLRIVDRGPGIPVDAREQVLEAFQRLGDRPNGMGVGLGLAVARGFVVAMGGDFRLDDTPGGGLTVTIDLPGAE